MNDDLRRVIFETFSEVFETMFFTFLEPLDELPSSAEAEEAAGDFVQALISYSGGEAGSFQFYFPKDLARNITVNFLGVDADMVQENQIEDTVAETANMAIGSLLGKLDPQGKSSLSIPQKKELSGFSPASLLAEPGLCVFNTEFGVLWVVGKHE